MNAVPINSAKNKIKIEKIHLFLILFFLFDEHNINAPSNDNDDIEFFLVFRTWSKT